ncbi:hypothetical protein HNY73_000999 [Argiope bruennichi]|uniref:Uncharacterized protein n=1 Tax=Argiope bruennichi TaxID=94029 RepID=A0A8T0G2I0_ARGBR|nr:hypothetical protein HNY73_000999 [Argiope bruennichi]
MLVSPPPKFHNTLIKSTSNIDGTCVDVSRRPPQEPQVSLKQDIPDAPDSSSTRCYPNGGPEPSLSHN